MTHSDEPPENDSREPTVILDDEDIDELEELSLDAVLDEIAEALEQTQKNAKLNRRTDGSSVGARLRARGSLLADIGKLGSRESDAPADRKGGVPSADEDSADSEEAVADANDEAADTRDDSDAPPA